MPEARSTRETINSGWIKIHRKLKSHWLWDDPVRLKWWIDILLTVNHDDHKVLIKGTLLDCARGQSVRSLDSWAAEWRVTKKTVRSFFLLLQKDSMVHFESVKVSTRLTVCNYNSYQDRGHAKETRSNGTVSAPETHPTPKQEFKEFNNKKNKKNSVSEDARAHEPAALLGDSENKAPADNSDDNDPKRKRFEIFQKWQREFAPRVGMMKEPLTCDQLNMIFDKYGNSIWDILKQMHNWEPLLTRNRSAAITLENWMKREKRNAMRYKEVDFRTQYSS